MNKKDKIDLKSYQFDNKTDYIVYLQEIIARTDKCIFKMKMYLEELKKIIEELNKKNNDWVSADIYSRYVDLLSNNTAYLLNIIGDKQKTSISYAKFRLVIGKRKLSNSLGFEMRDLDDEIEFYLKDLNIMRNWHNHVPESLLLSEIEMIRAGEFKPHRIQPIEVNFFKEIDITVIKDLLDSSQDFYVVCRKVHQSMKKDYSILIGESVKIVRVTLDKRKTLELFKASKLSGEVQGIIGEYNKNFS